MQRKWWVLASVACGTFMATLDSSIVNIGLPTLTTELNTDLHQVKWVVVAYLLVITCLLLPFGRIADLYGRKRTFILGFIIFTLGSGLCGFGAGLGHLILARLVQGVGAAMLMANGPAIITAAFPGMERGRALGTLAMVVSLGLITGPSIGGLIISELSWRFIFWINIPIGLLGIIAAHHNIQKDLAPKRKQTSFDWAGAVLQSVALIAVVLVFDPPRLALEGTSAVEVPKAILFGIALVFMAIFLKVESITPAPLFDLELFKNRTFWTANLASFLVFVAYSVVAILMPFYLEEVKGYRTDSAGILMAAIPVAIFVVAPLSGRLSDRLGSRGLSAAGALVGALALALMAGVFGTGIDEETPRAVLILSLGLIGVFLGLFQSPNNNALMGSVPKNKLSIASAFLPTVRNLGMATGTGLATALFEWHLDMSQHFVKSLQFTLQIASVVAVLAMIASFGKARGPYWK